MATSEGRDGGRIDETSRVDGEPEGSRSWGQRLRQQRRGAGLTQEELASRSGYSTDYIGKIEQGRRDPPPDAIRRLAAALRLDLTEHPLTEHPAREVASVRHREAPESGRFPLIGRAEELSRIDRFLSGGEPPTLLLAGEPGIGKTRLLEEAARRANAGGWQVIRGGCQQRAADPYAPLTDALAHALGRMEEGNRAEILEKFGWLDLILPELAGSASRGSGPSHHLTEARLARLPLGQERRLLFGSVAGCVRRLAGPAGTLLILDDLQWAGADGLDLLATLINSSDSPVVRLIGAYRDSEAASGAALHAFIADLARTALIRVLPLEPLSEAESQQLLSDLALVQDEEARAIRSAIVRRAGGVPFYLVSFAQEFVIRDGERAPALQMPWSVTQVIRQRVFALPESTRELLAIAAVVGQGIHHNLLAHVAGVNAEDALAALESGAAARLLEEEEDGRYRFSHDLIRETIEQDLSAGRRQVLHRRIGEVLEQSAGSPTELLADHFSRSDDADRALRYLALAGDEARRRFAHDAAADYYRQAIRRFEQLGRSSETGPIRESLGWALRAAGQYDEAIAALEQAGEIFESAKDEEAMYRVAGRVAEVHFRRGTGHDDLDQLARLTGHATSRHPDRESGGTIAIRRGLIRFLFAKGAYSQMLGVGQTVTRLGRAMHNEGLLTLGERTEGIALIFLGRLTEGVARLEAALPKGLAAGDQERIADLATALNVAYLAMGAFARSQALSRRMSAIAQTLNDPILIATHTRCLGTAIHCAGDWASGRALLQEADDLFAANGPSAYDLRTVSIRIIPLLCEGAWDRARSILEGVYQRATELRIPPVGRRALAFLAEIDLLEGSPQAALTRLAPLADANLAWPQAAPVLTTLAQANLALGDADRALTLAERAMAEIERTGNWFHGVAALRTRGMIALQRGQAERAQAAFNQGIRRARAMPYPFGEAQLLGASATLADLQGEDQSAENLRREAQRILRRLRSAGGSRGLVASEPAE